MSVLQDIMFLLLYYI